MKKKEKVKLPFNDTVRICSHTWRVVPGGKNMGGHFCTVDADGTGTIAIGTHDKKPFTKRFMTEVLLHEIVESILAVDDRRYQENGNKRTIFVFDHDYLDSLGPKLLDALESVGLVKL